MDKWLFCKVEVAKYRKIAPFYVLYSTLYCIVLKNVLILCRYSLTFTIKYISHEKNVSFF
jgi:hypothetical protein